MPDLRAGEAAGAAGGGSEEGRAAAPRGARRRGALVPRVRGEAPLPAAGRGGQLLSGGSWGFFCPCSPPQLSPVTGKGLKSPASRGNLSVWRGAGCAAFPLTAESRGRGGLSLSLSLAPHQPGRTVPWRGQEKQKIIKEGPTDAMRLRDFHRRDPPPFPGRESRAVPGGPRGCPGWACSRSAPLRVASAAAARQLEAPIAPSVAAVPRFPRREAGGGGREEGVPPLPVRAAGQRARRSHPAGSPAAGWAAPSLPSPGRCSRGGRRRAEERRGNGAWS